jgi:hypothetical protein
MASKVLDNKLRGLLERYESDVSDAAEYVTEKLSGIVERLIDEFGAPAVDAALKGLQDCSRLAQGPARSVRSCRGRPVAGRVVGIMATKSLKESLKAARKDASRQVLAQIAVLIEERPDMSYRRIAEHFGCGTGLVCQAAAAAGLSRPRGSASPAFKKATK